MLTPEEHLQLYRKTVDGCRLAVEQIPPARLIYLMSGYKPDEGEVMHMAQIIMACRNMLYPRYEHAKGAALGQ